MIAGHLSKWLLGWNQAAKQPHIIKKNDWLLIFGKL
jgi:hypothetical protein